MPIADIDYREYFTPERIEQLSNAFNKYDVKGAGSLGESELYTMFKKLGKSLTRHQLHEVMKEVDIDGHGDIDFEKMCVLEIKMIRARPRASLIDYRDYLEEKTIRQLQQLFVQQDSVCESLIGITELYRILELLGCQATQEEVEEVFADVDSEGTGEIEFAKLCAVWAVLTRCRKRTNYREFLSLEQMASLRQTFEAADERGFGRITRTELDQLLRSLGVNFKPSSLNALMKDFDVDESGDIDFEEFCVMMLRVKGLRRKRFINPDTCNCVDLWREEQFTIRELQQSGFGLDDFKKVGIPVGKIYKEGEVSALELRRAGYLAAELRRGGLGAGELRRCGFSLAELRNAGFSDAVLSQTNRDLQNSLSAGDFSTLAQIAPDKRGLQHAAFGAERDLRRQLTPVIRENTDWCPKLSRSQEAAA